MSLTFFFTKVFVTFYMLESKKVVTKKRETFRHLDQKCK